MNKLQRLERQIRRVFGPRLVKDTHIPMRL